MGSVFTASVCFRNMLRQYSRVFPTDRMALRASVALQHGYNEVQKTNLPMPHRSRE